MLLSSVKSNNPKKAISKFEETIKLVCESGAGDRETALRWLMEASEADGDWDYFCYLNGIPCGYVE